ncbi:hypothetical protein PoB_001138000 [Plakobranchus ocellatus]|uniref:Uncharacterized protein n=1 Tax=Plakobranchus ocellatus TaxID=259542 RepID=A0AAV3YP13_9GAST|nr:hypothetical protein PoB_001138000 [Plakobranchus ocellatus]
MGGKLTLKSARNFLSCVSARRRLLNKAGHMAQRNSEMVFRRTVTTISSPGWNTISCAGSVTMCGKSPRVMKSDCE